MLLENERVLMCFTFPYAQHNKSSTSAGQPNWQPRCGAGHKARACTVGLHYSISQVLSKITDVPVLKSPPADGDLSDELKTSSDNTKDVGQFGLDVVDQISAAAGLQAKDKRDKSKSSSSDRPPTRRGARATGELSSALLPVTVPLLQLCHHQVGFI